LSQPQRPTKGSTRVWLVLLPEPFEGGVFDDGFVEVHFFGGLGFLGFGNFFKLESAAAQPFKFILVDGAKTRSFKAEMKRRPP